MIGCRPFNPLAAADHGRLKITRHSSCGGDWNAASAGGIVVTSLALVVRALLVTTTAVATVAYLLLTNSHI